MRTEHLRALNVSEETSNWRSLAVTKKLTTENTEDTEKIQIIFSVSSVFSVVKNSCQNRKHLRISSTELEILA